MVHIHKQNTGSVLFAFSFSLCVCCASFIGLCCGEFPRIVSLISALGCLLTAVVTCILIGECMDACLIITFVQLGVALPSLSLLIALRSQP